MKVYVALVPETLSKDKCLGVFPDELRALMFYLYKVCAQCRVSEGLENEIKNAMADIDHVDIEVLRSLKDKCVNELLDNPFGDGNFMSGVEVHNI